MSTEGVGGPGDVNISFRPKTGETKALSNQARDKILKVLRDKAPDAHEVDVQPLEYKWVKPGEYFEVTAGKTTFVVKVEGGEGEALVTQELVRKKSFAQSFRGFFQSVLAFFFSPTTDLRNSPRERMENGHSEILSSIKQGKTWVTDSDAALLVDSAIENGERIAKVLKKPIAQQAKALEELVEVLESGVMEGNGGCLPMGYIGIDGAFQPLILRFFKEGDAWRLEIYNDEPSQSRFEPTETFGLSGPDIPSVLRHFLNPLFQIDTAKQVVLRAKEVETVSSILPKGPQSAKIRPEGAPPSTYGVAYRQLVDSCPKKLTLVEPAKQVTMKAVMTAPSRVAKWLNQLPGAEKMRPSAKLNILMDLTQEWVERKLETLPSSPRARIEELSSMRDQLEQVSEKATAYLTGEKIGPAVLSSQFQRTLEEVKGKLDKITAEERTHALQLRTEGLQQSYSSTISADVHMPVGAGEHSFILRPKVQQSVLEVDVQPILKDYQAHFKSFSALVSPQAQQQYAIVQERALLKELLGDDYEAVMQKEPKAFLEEIDKRLAVTEDEIGSMSGVQKQDLDALVRTIRCLRIAPHLLPESGKVGEHLQRIRTILHPDYHTEKENPKEQLAIKKLRARIELACLLPPSALRELEMEGCPPDAKAVLKEMSPFEAIAGLEISTSEAGLEISTSDNYVSNVTESLSQLQNDIAALKKSAFNQGNPEIKKALYHEIAERSFAILQALPKVHCGAFARTCAFWEQLDDRQRGKLQGLLDSIEHDIWEAKMKLSAPALTAKEELLLYKAQTIRMAMVRTMLREKLPGLKAHITKNLQEQLERRALQVPEAMKDKIKWDSEKNELYIDWSMLGIDEYDFLKSCIKDVPDAELIGLDRVTLNVNGINAFVTQQLDICLSEHPELEEELLTVYDFVRRDQHGDFFLGMHPEQGFSRYGQRVAFVSEHPPPIANGAYAHLLKLTRRTDLPSEMVSLCTSHAYFRMMKDPESVLFAGNPHQKRGLFGEHPDYFLNMHDISIGKMEVNFANAPCIQNKQNERLASLFLSGHPDDGMRPDVRQEFSPAVRCTPDQPDVQSGGLRETRTLLTVDQWAKSMSKEARNKHAEIPPDVLTVLRTIRMQKSMPGDKFYAERITAYNSDSAILALQFICDQGHFEYLQLDSVQRYLYETFSGAFVLQGALLRHAVSFSDWMALLDKAIDRAVDEKKYSTLGFLENVKTQVACHIDAACARLSRDGFLDPFMGGNLPEQTRMALDEDGFLGNRDAMRTDFQKNQNRWNKDCYDKLSITQPLLYTYTKLKKFRKAIRDTSEHIDLIARRMEEITDESQHTEKIRLATHLLQHYRLQGGSLDKADLQRVLSAYLTIGETHDWEALEPSQQHLFSWVRSAILPQLAASDQRHDILNHLSGNTDQGSWEVDIQHPYRYEFHGTEAHTVDFLVCSVGVSKEVKKKSTPLRALPASVLQRSEVVQAFGEGIIYARKTGDGKRGTHYMWDQEDVAGKRSYRIDLVGDRCHITMSVAEEHYVFMPMNVSANGQAEHLLNRYGVWKKESTNTLHIMRPPASTPEYTLEEEHGQRRLCTPDRSLRVANDSHCIEADLVPFAAPNDLIVLLDPKTKKIGQLRLDGTDIALKHREGTWVCYRGAQEIGRIDPTCNEQMITTYFGGLAHEFVIPLVTDSGEKQFVIIPYAVHRDGRKVHIEQKVMAHKTTPFLVSFDTSGSLVAPPECFLYLAHAARVEADAMVYSGQAEKRYLAARKWVEAACKAAPLSKAADYAHLETIADLIKCDPITESNYATCDALATQLRMLLAIRAIRDRSVSSTKVPQLSLVDDFQEMTMISQLFTYYRKAKKKEGRPLELALEEVAALEEINHRMLRQLASEVPEEALPAQLKRAISRDLKVELPAQVSPEFLLALVRYARPGQSKGIDIGSATGPLLLSTLLENFWDYANNIRANHPSPEKLGALFQPVTLPPTASEEEHARLKTVELQARQFLLAIAWISHTAHTKQEEKDTGFKAFQEMAQGLPDELTELKSIKEKITKLGVANINDVTYEKLSKSLDEEQEILSQKMKALSKTFSETLEKLSNLRRATQSKERIASCLQELKDKAWRLPDESEGLKSLKREIAVLDAPAISDEVCTNLSKSLVKEQGILQGILLQKMNEMNKQMPHFSWALDRLNNLSNLFEAAQPILEGNRIISRLFQERYAPTISLEGVPLPEKEAIDMAIRMLKNEKKESWVELFRVLGPMGVLHADALKQFFEASKSDMAILMALCEPVQRLGSLVLSLRPGKPQETGLKVGASLDAFLKALPSTLFSEEQKEIIRKNYYKLSTLEQATYLQQIATLLDQNKELTAASIQLNRTLEQLNADYPKMLSSPINEPNEEDIPLFSCSSASIRDRYHNQYANYFHAWSDFPSKEARDAWIERLGSMRPSDKRNFVQAAKLAASGKSLALQKDKTSTAILRALYHMGQLQNKDSKTLMWLDYWKRLTETLMDEPNYIGPLIKELSTELGRVCEAEQKQEHLDIVKELGELLPKDDPSEYYQGLKHGIDALKDAPPIPYRDVVGRQEVDALGKTMMENLDALKQEVDGCRRRICSTLFALPSNTLPIELQKARRMGLSEEALLEMALKLHRKGLFLDRKYAETYLDIEMSDYLILRTSEKQLVKAMSIQKAMVELGKQEFTDAQESIWKEKSAELKDLIDRCQNPDLYSRLRNDFPELAPYARTIFYVQYRRGIVLREEQFTAICELISKPSMLKEMRMGLGKTSVIFPIVLEIMGKKGLIPIGIVPKALFSSNFDEMDEDTRLLFDLCGNRFEFDREAFRVPLSETSLVQLSKRCLAFLNAKKMGEYTLTTIEAKASLDNKIIEVETERSALWKKYEMAEKALQSCFENEKADSMRAADALFKQVVDYDRALSLLYRIQATFEHEKTRIVIDEADEVAKASFSVNSELTTSKKAVDPEVQECVHGLFHMIATENSLKGLLNAILTNTQFTLSKFSPNELKQFQHELGRLWLAQHKEIENQVKGLDLRDWFSGAPWPAGGHAIPRELAIARKAIQSGITRALDLQIGLSCEVDMEVGVVGVPAFGGVVSASTKYSDPIMQLALTDMIAIYQPPSNAFIKSVANEVYKNLASDSDAKNEFMRIIGEAKDNPTFDWSKALRGGEEWQVLLRLKVAEQAAKRKLISVCEEQILRPVQHAIRGCNNVCMTGTATRNLEYVVENLKSVSRAVTAEVLYRILKSMPKEARAQLKTYPVESEKALKAMCAIVQDHTYSAIINQGAVADTFTTLEVVKSLYDVSKRPIVFLNSETGKKSVYRGGDKVELLDEVPKGALKDAFYYYDAASVRGTNFVIPLGTKACLFLSPLANARARDQAGYRMRSLGEGHTLDLRAFDGVQDRSLRAVLQQNHEITKEDELKENHQALKLDIQAKLEDAAKRLKSELHQMPIPLTATRGDQEVVAMMRERVQIADATRELFVQDTSMKQYYEQLEREARSGGEQETKAFLLDIINREQAKGASIRDSAPPELDKLKNAMDQAILSLDTRKEDINTNWDTTYRPNQPEKVSKTAASDQVASVEADADVEADVANEMLVQAQDETEQEVFAVCDEGIADNVPEATKKKNFLDIECLVNPVDVDDRVSEDARRVQTIGEFNRKRLPLFQTPVLQELLQEFQGSERPQMVHFVLKDDLKDDRGKGVSKGAKIVSMQAQQAAHYFSHLTASDFHVQDFIGGGKKSYYGGFFMAVQRGDGLDFVSYGDIPGFQPLSLNPQERGRLLLQQFYLGYTQFSEENMQEMEEAFKGMTFEEMCAYEPAIRKSVKDRNTIAYQKYWENSLLKIMQQKGSDWLNQ